MIQEHVTIEALRKESDMEGYPNSLAHLVEELRRLDLMIRFQVEQVKCKALVQF